MDKNKKIFIIVAIVFLILMIIIGIDISNRTIFPGSKGNLEERIPAGDDASSLEENNQPVKAPQ